MNVDGGKLLRSTEPSVISGARRRARLRSLLTFVSLGGLLAGCQGNQHHKDSFDECTFEFDAPETLKPEQRDGMSFTLKSEHYTFDGFAGAQLYGLEGRAGMGSIDIVHKATAAGVHLAVARTKPPSPRLVGSGEQAERPNNNLGCAFNCMGEGVPEADVLAMCKSVRISIDPSKAPK